MSQFAQRILFATDLSEHAAHALRVTITLAASTGGEIHVLHAPEPLTNEQKVTLRMFMQDSARRKEALKGRKQHLDEMLTEWTFEATRAQKKDGTADAIKSQKVIEGNPVEVILHQAHELKCDLITLASHEYGSSLDFLGSVGQRILRHTSIPTLVIPFNGFQG